MHVADIRRFTQASNFEQGIHALQLNKPVQRISTNIHRHEVPYYLARPCHVTTLIIRDVHERLAHAGRNHVLAQRPEKYWVIHGNAAVRHVLYRCVVSRKLRSPTSE